MSHTPELIVDFPEKVIQGVIAEMMEAAKQRPDGCSYAHTHTVQTQGPKKDAHYMSEVASWAQGRCSEALSACLPAGTEFAVIVRPVDQKLCFHSSAFKKLPAMYDENMDRSDTGPLLKELGNWLADKDRAKPFTGIAKIHTGSVPDPCEGKDENGDELACPITDYASEVLYNAAYELKTTVRWFLHYYDPTATEGLHMQTDRDGDELTIIVTEPRHRRVALGKEEDAKKADEDPKPAEGEKRPSPEGDLPPPEKRARTETSTDADAVPLKTPSDLVSAVEGHIGSCSADMRATVLRVVGDLGRGLPQLPAPSRVMVSVYDVMLTWPWGIVSVRDDGELAVATDVRRPRVSTTPATDTELHDYIRKAAGL